MTRSNAHATAQVEMLACPNYGRRTGLDELRVGLALPVRIGSSRGMSTAQGYGATALRERCSNSPQSKEPE